MKKMIDIPFGSSRYDDLVELRYKVLLEPLGLKFLDMHRDQGSRLSSHRLHRKPGRRVGRRTDSGAGQQRGNPHDAGCCRQPLSGRRHWPRNGKIQPKNAPEKPAYSRLVMHAMLSVVNFYEKMGYRQEGEIFEDQGITFARMVKNLN